MDKYNLSTNYLSLINRNGVTVCDSVYQTKLDTRSGIIFLALGGKFPKQPLTIEIFNRDVENFPEMPDSFFMNKRVCVTGTISQYKGKWQIVIKQPDEILIKQD